MKNLKFTIEVLKDTAKAWNEANVFKDSAAMAYYALFSIPGLLIIVIWLAGHFFGAEAIQGEISAQISGIMGTEVANSIENFIVAAEVDEDNTIMKIIGICGLVFGSTTLFFQLQKSLNAMWDVEPAPNKALKGFLLARANSLGLIFVIGFLMMITMLLSSIIGLANHLITQYFGMQTYVLMRLVNETVGFAIVTILFAMMFKILPDAKISWHSVWVGAVVTTILFSLGKFILSLYFGQFKPTSSFGTAGTVILLMMWINYSCLLLFFGAKFTKIYTTKKNLNIQPAPYAKWKQ